MKKQLKPTGYRIKLTLLVVFGLCALQSVAAPQDSKVTLPSREITIEEAFGEIHRQTGLVIAVNHSAFDTNRKVALPSASGTTNEILTNLLAGTGQAFEVKGNYVMLRPAPQQPAVKQPATPVTAVVSLAPVRPAPSVAEAATVLLGDSQSMSAPSPAASEEAVPESPAAAPRAGWERIPAVAGAPQPDGFVKQRLPLIAVKTNLLDDATTSINLGLEVRLSDQWTLHLPVSYNPWSFSDNKQWRHLTFVPEARYWSAESFNGHFLGIHGIYSYFNAGNVDMPLGIWPELKDYRYEGSLYGAGVSYGYQWILGKHWGLEATLGMGYFYADYKQYDCATCGQEVDRDYKHYFGPTKAGISMLFFIK